MGSAVSKRLIKAVLSTVVVFLLVYACFIFAYYASGNLRQIPWLYSLTLPSFLFLAYLRRQIKSIPMFLIIHLVYLILPTVVLGPLHLATIMLALLLFHSVWAKAGGEFALKRAASVISVFVLGGLLILLQALDISSTLLLGVYVIFSLIIMACIMAYVQIDAMDHNIMLFEISGHHNAKKTFMASNIGVIILISITLSVGFLASFFPADAFFASVFGFVAMTAGRIFYFFAAGTANILGFFFPGSRMVIPQSTYEAEEFNPLTQEQLDMLRERALYMRDWTDYERNTLVSPVALGIVICIAVALVILLILYIRYRTRENKIENEEKLSLTSDISLGKILSGFKGFTPNFKSTMKHPIRRTYIKKINKYIKKGVNIETNYTPDKIAEKIAPHEDIGELTVMYEEVRYGR